MLSVFCISNGVQSAVRLHDDAEAKLRQRWLDAESVYTEKVAAYNHSKLLAEHAVADVNGARGAVDRMQKDYHDAHVESEVLRRTVSRLREAQATAQEAYMQKRHWSDAENQALAEARATFLDAEKQLQDARFARESQKKVDEAMGKVRVQVQKAYNDKMAMKLLANATEVTRETDRTTPHRNVHLADIAFKEAKSRYLETKQRSQKAYRAAEGEFRKAAFLLKVLEESTKSSDAQDKVAAAMMVPRNNAIAIYEEAKQKMDSTSSTMAAILANVKTAKSKMLEAKQKLDVRKLRVNATRQALLEAKRVFDSGREGALSMPKLP